MNNSTNRLMSGILLLSMFGLIAIAGGKAAIKAQAPQNVLVTNTTSAPVPVSVTGTPTVKVTQGGAFAVTVNNSSGNKALVLASQLGTWNVNENNGDRSAVTLGTTFMITTTSIDSGNVLLYTVPAGKRFILKSESAYCIAELPLAYASQFIMNVANRAVLVPMNLTLGSDSLTTANANIEMVADAGQTVAVDVRRELTLAIAPISIVVTITGHLINYP